MSIEELLKTRYKQINDWPFMGNAYKIGKVFVFNNDIDTGIICKYPHLFRKMEWWEERKEEDMPKYLKSPQSVWKVIYYHIEYSWVVCYKEGNVPMPLKHLLPATEQEYLEQTTPEGV